MNTSTIYKIHHTFAAVQFAKDNGAHWLLDLIGSHLFCTPAVTQESMTFWTITRKGSKAVAVATDGGKGGPEVVLAKQNIPHTDLPVESVRIWTTRTEDRYGNVIFTIMLPEDY